MSRYLKARLGRFLGVMLLTIISDALIVGSSVVQQRLIDAVMALDLTGVRFYIPVAIVYTIFYAMVFVVSSLCQNMFGAKLINDIRQSVFRGIMRRNRTDFADHHTADYVSALTNDLHRIHGQFLNMFYMVVLSAASIVFSVALMCWYQPVVAICAVIGALVMTIVPSILGRVIGRWEKRRSERLVALTTMLSECFAGFETIATFGIQHHMKRRFEQCSRELLNCEYRTEGLDALSDGLSQFLSALAQTLILSLSCVMVSYGKMALGALVVFISLNTTLCGSLSMVLRGVPMLKGIQPVVDRVNHYADYAYADHQGDTEPTFKNSIMMKDLSFSYNAESSVLTNLSMTLQSGGKYALIGESGSGKSTLIHLLIGDYPNYVGGIFYDGTELRELNRHKLNRVVACIHQDVFLFDDTIRNNICLFDDFSDEQFEWAVKTSGVQKFIETLSDGAEYVVGQHGERLSGGQKQRIAIARALIRNTNFLILDESTSALDEQTALEIESELLKLKGLTLLTITHHLKNPQAYDAVFSLSHGEIAVKIAS